MSNEIEIEAKVLVSRKEFETLRKAFADHKPYSQTNYYIDNEHGHLTREGIALRIREKKGVYEMTLKTPLSQGLLEKNERIEESQFVDFRDKGIFPKCDLVRFLTMMDFDVDSLKIITSLTTERVDVEISNGLLSLDKNVYSGITDYEVEFEYNNLDGAKKIVKELLEKYGIEANFNKITKSHRALEAIHGK